MNAAYFRALVCEELCETIMWGQMVDNFDGFKTKEKDKKGVEHYRLSLRHGQVLVYSPKAIYVDGKKFNSVGSAKVYLQTNHLF